MEFKTLGDRMKHYESFSPPRMMPRQPVLIRLDGRAFHTWTKGLDRPFDPFFHNAMKATTRLLAEEANACCAYTQSDEISLVLDPNSDEEGRYIPNSDVWFDGRRDKINSILAATCSIQFMGRLAKSSSEVLRNKPSALFDCRCWNVPDRMEAINYLIWREQDAVRNSIQSLGQHLLGHARMNGLKNDAVQELVFQEHGVNWNNLDDWKKRGTYVRRFYDELPMNDEEESQPTFRRRYQRSHLPRLTQILNREEVVFFGQDPCTEAAVLP